MRAKILTSLVIIALASALAGGATYAVFTHRAEIEGNLISSGNLEFDLVGDPFNVTNMKPGDSVEGYIEIANTGSLDMIFRTFIEPDVTSTPGFTDQLLASVIINPTDYVSQNYGSYVRYGPANKSLCDQVPLTYL
ncbi:MAG: TasA family protein, partial [Dethiobacteria bacterium]